MNEQPSLPRPSLLPDKAYFQELRRPWKLATLAAGMAWLLYGAFFYDISDWDAGVSFIMAGITYLCAPWSVHLLHQAVRSRPRYMVSRGLAAMVPAFFAVDWSYWLYHTIRGNRMIRWENFKASMALYFLCGVVWYYRGPFREMTNDLLSIIRGRKYR